MSIQFKRKYVEVTVRGTKLLFEVIPTGDQKAIFQGWEDKFDITLNQIQSGQVPLELLDELISEIHKRYSGEEELTTEALESLDPLEIATLFKAISYADDKNHYTDPKVVLK